MITQEQLKKENSEFYKLGYKMGYLSLTTFLKTIIPEKDFQIYRHKIKEHYENYPIMEEFEELNLT